MRGVEFAHSTKPYFSSALAREAKQGLAAGLGLPLLPSPLILICHKIDFAENTGGSITCIYHALHFELARVNSVILNG